jgi:hypothetical protein
VIHTGGVRLAATGGVDFPRRYTKRRASLADAGVEPLTFDQILADDHYGIVHGRFRTSRGDWTWSRVGMGAWRFKDGVAVEHWELSDGPTWDEFFLAGDPASFTVRRRSSGPATSDAPPARRLHHRLSEIYISLDISIAVWS